ncbi:UNVERIFIED_CONTAM: hypothetical protein HHA_313210 [Hammondia hammondi]|eukprot:XP_008883598.1 hypothetical protein HHA_313210 [Hammondia hammondi]
MAHFASNPLGSPQPFFQAAVETARENAKGSVRRPLTTAESSGFFQSREPDSPLTVAARTLPAWCLPQLDRVRSLLKRGSAPWPRERSVKNKTFCDRKTPIWSTQHVSRHYVELPASAEKDPTKTCSTAAPGAHSRDRGSRTLQHSSGSCGEDTTASREKQRLAEGCRTDRDLKRERSDTWKKNPVSSLRSSLLQKRPPACPGSLEWGHEPRFESNGTRPLISSESLWKPSEGREKWREGWGALGLFERGTGHGEKAGETPQKETAADFLPARFSFPDFLPQSSHATSFALSSSESVSWTEASEQEGEEACSLGRGRTRKKESKQWDLSGSASGRGRRRDCGGSSPSRAKEKTRSARRTRKGRASSPPYVRPIRTGETPAPSPLTRTAILLGLPTSHHWTASSPTIQSRSLRRRESRTEKSAKGVSTGADRPRTRSTAGTKKLRSGGVGARRKQESRENARQEQPQEALTPVAGRLAPSWGVDKKDREEACRKGGVKRSNTYRQEVAERRRTSPSPKRLSLSSRRDPRVAETYDGATRRTKSTTQGVANPSGTREAPNATVCEKDACAPPPKAPTSRESLCGRALSPSLSFSAFSFSPIPGPSETPHRERGEGNAADGKAPLTADREGEHTGMEKRRKKREGEVVDSTFTRDTRTVADEKTPKLPGKRRTSSERETRKVLSERLDFTERSRKTEETKEKADKKQKKEKKEKEDKESKKEKKEKEDKESKKEKKEKEDKEPKKEKKEKEDKESKKEKKEKEEKEGRGEKEERNSLVPLPGHSCASPGFCTTSILHSTDPRSSRRSPSPLVSTHAASTPPVGSCASRLPQLSSSAGDATGDMQTGDAREAAPLAAREGHPVSVHRCASHAGEGRCAPRVKMRGRRKAEEKRMQATWTRTRELKEVEENADALEPERSPRRLEVAKPLDEEGREKPHPAEDPEELKKRNERREAQSMSGRAEETQTGDAGVTASWTSHGLCSSSAHPLTAGDLLERKGSNASAAAPHAPRAAPVPKFPCSSSACVGAQTDAADSWRQKHGDAQCSRDSTRRSCCPDALAEAAESTRKEPLFGVSENVFNMERSANISRNSALSGFNSTTLWGPPFCQSCACSAALPSPQRATKSCKTHFHQESHLSSSSSSPSASSSSSSSAACSCSSSSSSSIVSPGINSAPVVSVYPRDSACEPRSSLEPPVTGTSVKKGGKLVSCCPDSVSRSQCACRSGACWSASPSIPVVSSDLPASSSPAASLAGPPTAKPVSFLGSRGATPAADVGCRMQRRASSPCRSSSSCSTACSPSSFGPSCSSSQVLSGSSRLPSFGGESAPQVAEASRGSGVRTPETPVRRQGVRTLAGSSLAKDKETRGREKEFGGPGIEEVAVGKMRRECKQEDGQGDREQGGDNERENGHDSDGSRFRAPPPSLDPAKEQEQLVRQLLWEAQTSLLLVWELCGLSKDEPASRSSPRKGGRFRAAHPCHVDSTETGSSSRLSGRGAEAAKTVSRHRNARDRGEAGKHQDEQREERGEKEKDLARTEDRAEPRTHRGAEAGEQKPNNSEGGTHTHEGGQVSPPTSRLRAKVLQGLRENENARNPEAARTDEGHYKEGHQRKDGYEREDTESGGTHRRSPPDSTVCTHSSFSPRSAGQPLRRPLCVERRPRTDETHQEAEEARRGRNPRNRGHRRSEEQESPLLQCSSPSSPSPVLGKNTTIRDALKPLFAAMEAAICACASAEVSESTTRRLPSPSWFTASPVPSPSQDSFSGSSASPLPLTFPCGLKETTCSGRVRSRADDGGCFREVSNKRQCDCGRLPEEVSAVQTPDRELGRRCGAPPGASRRQAKPSRRRESLSVPSGCPLSHASASLSHPCAQRRGFPTRISSPSSTSRPGSAVPSFSSFSRPRRPLPPFSWSNTQRFPTSSSSFSSFASSSCFRHDAPGLSAACLWSTPRGLSSPLSFLESHLGAGCGCDGFEVTKRSGFPFLPHASSLPGDAEIARNAKEIASICWHARPAFPSLLHAETRTARSWLGTLKATDSCAARVEDPKEALQKEEGNDNRRGGDREDRKRRDAWDRQRRRHEVADPTKLSVGENELPPSSQAGGGLVDLQTATTAAETPRQEEPTESERIDRERREEDGRGGEGGGGGNRRGRETQAGEDEGGERGEDEGEARGNSGREGDEEERRTDQRETRTDAEGMHTRAKTGTRWRERAAVGRRQVIRERSNARRGENSTRDEDLHRRATHRETSEPTGERGTSEEELWRAAIKAALYRQKRTLEEELKQLEEERQRYLRQHTHTLSMDLHGFKENLHAPAPNPSPLSQDGTPSADRLRPELPGWTFPSSSCPTLRPDASPTREQCVVSSLSAFPSSASSATPSAVLAAGPLSSFSSAIPSSCRTAPSSGSAASRRDCQGSRASPPSSTALSPPSSSSLPSSSASSSSHRLPLSKSPVSALPPLPPPASRCRQTVVREKQFDQSRSRDSPETPSRVWPLRRGVRTSEDSSAGLRIQSAASSARTSTDAISKQWRFPELLPDHENDAHKPGVDRRTETPPQESPSPQITPHHADRPPAPCSDARFPQSRRSPSASLPARPSASSAASFSSLPSSTLRSRGAPSAAALPSSSSSLATNGQTTSPLSLCPPFLSACDSASWSSHSRRGCGGSPEFCTTLPTTPCMPVRPWQSPFISSISCLDSATPFLPPCREGPPGPSAASQAFSLPPVASQPSSTAPLHAHIRAKTSGVCSLSPPLHAAFLAVPSSSSKSFDSSHTASFPSSFFSSPTSFRPPSAASAWLRASDSAQIHSFSVAPSACVSGSASSSFPSSCSSSSSFPSSCSSSSSFLSSCSSSSSFPSSASSSLPPSSSSSSFRLSFHSPVSYAEPSCETHEEGPKASGGKPGGGVHSGVSIHRSPSQLAAERPQNAAAFVPPSSPVHAPCERKEAEAEGKEVAENGCDEERRSSRSFARCPVPSQRAAQEIPEKRGNREDSGNCMRRQGWAPVAIQRASDREEDGRNEETGVQSSPFWLACQAENQERTHASTFSPGRSSPFAAWLRLPSVIKQQAASEASAILKAYILR